MPSAFHEALLALFRNLPGLAPELIRDALGVPLPPWSSIEVREAAFTDLAPAEYRADLVLLLRRKRPVFAVVLEVQLAIDASKRFRWPVYATALRDRYRCPTAVLVVTPRRKVAIWAAQPIEIGTPGSVFRPLVVGPDNVPWVHPGDEVAPETAVLSALAHSDEPNGLDTVLAALVAAASLDETRAKLYYDFVLSRLDVAMRVALEDLMQARGYEYQSAFARKYLSQGKAEGQAELLRSLITEQLSERSIRVDEVQRRHLGETTDLETLHVWFRRAMRATSAGEVFDDGPATGSR